MKRRQITAIIAALALAVTSTALLTGCVGKSYYYKKNDDGSLERVGEIKKSTEEAASTTSTETSSTDPTEESKSEEPADESSEEPADESSEEPADESSEEPADESSEEPADESSEEASSDSGETDDNTLAVLTVEMPTDWDAQDVVFKISDSNAKSSSPEVKSEGDGVFSCTVSKFADDGEAFVDAKFNVVFKKGESGTTKTTEDTVISGSKTYTAVQEGKKYILTEK